MAASTTTNDLESIGSISHSSRFFCTPKSTCMRITRDPPWLRWAALSGGSIFQRPSSISAGMTRRGLSLRAIVFTEFADESLMRKPVSHREGSSFWNLSISPDALPGGGGLARRFSSRRIPKTQVNSFPVYPPGSTVSRVQFFEHVGGMEIVQVDEAIDNVSWPIVPERRYQARFVRTAG
jgi:hypothetical protein